MKKSYIQRIALDEIQFYLREFPSVAIIGPRQCGKSTLARQIASETEGAIYLDLEKQSDLLRLQDAELFFRTNKDKLICIDEIQNQPYLFNTLRSVIDENEVNGQMLLLGSASRNLLQKGSESLAGRIIFKELTTFLYEEIADETDNDEILQHYWLNGGFPRSYLASSELASMAWRKSYIETFMERDIPQLGYNIAAATLKRFWRVVAHQHGQMINFSKIGADFGLTHTTIKSYFDLLTQTFMIRQLQCYDNNFGKRQVKTPKVYLRDTGILHTLLDISNFNELLAHPTLGTSWESFVIENVIATLSDYEPSYYRTSAGAEIDLIMSKGNRRIGIECKAATSPIVTKGFWNVIEDQQLTEIYVVAPIIGTYPLKQNVTVTSLGNLIKTLKKIK